MDLGSVCIWWECTMQWEHSRDAVLCMGPEHYWCIWLDANGTGSLEWERKSRPAKEFKDQTEEACRLTGADRCSSAFEQSWWWSSVLGLAELYRAPDEVSLGRTAADVPFEVSFPEYLSLQLHCARGWVQRLGNPNWCCGSSCIFYALSWLRVCVSDDICNIIEQLHQETWGKELKKEMTS